jgi:hypothetical protein
MAFGQERDELLRRAVPQTATQVDSGEPISIDGLAIYKRAVWRPRVRRLAWLVDVETTADVRLAHFAYHRALPPERLV